MAQEATRKQKLLADFIDEAPSLYEDALTHNFDDPAKLVHLYGALSKVRLFASQTTIEAADAVLRTVIVTYRMPNLNLRTTESVQRGHFDPFLAFTKACREEPNS